MGQWLQLHKKDRIKTKASFLKMPDLRSSLPELANH